MSHRSWNSRHGFHQCGYTFERFFYQGSYKRLPPSSVWGVKPEAEVSRHTISLVDTMPGATTGNSELVRECFQQTPPGVRTFDVKFLERIILYSLKNIQITHLKNNNNHKYCTNLPHLPPKTWEHYDGVKHWREGHCDVGCSSQPADSDCFLCLVMVGGRIYPHQCNREINLLTQ